MTSFDARTAAFAVRAVAGRCAYFPPIIFLTLEARLLRNGFTAIARTTAHSATNPVRYGMRLTGI